MCSDKTSTVRCRKKNKGMVPSTADSSGVQYSAKDTWKLTASIGLVFKHKFRRWDK